MGKGEKGEMVTPKGDRHHLQRLTWLVERTKERTTEKRSQPKKCSCNAAAGYQGPVKIERLESAGQPAPKHTIRMSD